MKLVTWNCCRGALETKLPHLDRLQPDIAVIQEISKPAAERPDCLWFGHRPRQGLAVVAKPPYKISRVAPRPGVADFVIPLAVKGPVDFLLFAVWTLGAQPQPYIRAVSSAMDAYADLLDAGKPVVFMGDFNSNALWDRQHPAHLNHSAMVERMQRYGLVSAYHHARSVEHGREPDHTFFWHWNPDKGYHIDYCFIPQSWADRIDQVQVGTFEEWQKLSDHRPLLVGIAETESWPARRESNPRQPA